MWQLMGQGQTISLLNVGMILCFLGLENAFFYPVLNSRNLQFAILLYGWVKQDILGFFYTSWVNIGSLGLGLPLPPCPRIWTESQITIIFLDPPPIDVVPGGVP